MKKLGLDSSSKVLVATIVTTQVNPTKFVVVI